MVILVNGRKEVDTQTGWLSATRRRAMKRHMQLLLLIVALGLLPGIVDHRLYLDRMGLVEDDASTKTAEAKLEALYPAATTDDAKSVQAQNSSPLVSADEAISDVVPDIISSNPEVPGSGAPVISSPGTSSANSSVFSGGSFSTAQVSGRNSSSRRSSGSSFNGGGGSFGGSASGGSSVPAPGIPEIAAIEPGPSPLPDSEPEPVVEPIPDPAPVSDPEKEDPPLEEPVVNNQDPENPPSEDPIKRDSTERDTTEENSEPVIGAGLPTVETFTDPNDRPVNFFEGDTFLSLFLLEIGGTLVDGQEPDVNQINTALDGDTTEFDQINVFGEARIGEGATIIVRVDELFMPEAGDFFDIITGDQVIANLALLEFQFPELDGFDFEFDIVSGIDRITGTIREALRLTLIASDFTLFVEGSNGDSFILVPEPATWLLFVLGILLIVRLRRQA